MKSATFQAPGEISLEDFKTPQLEEGFTLVKNLRVAICGSDLHMLHDAPSSVFPYRPGQPGHECVGVLEDGGRVLMIPPDFNAFAPFVPVRKQDLIDIPDHLSTEEAVLAQQLGTVIFCCKNMPDVFGKNVVVLGQGPAGLLFTSLLASKGARRIVGLDIVDHRIATSLKMGADFAFNTTAQGFNGEVLEAFDGKKADIVIEVVGKQETINLAIDLVRHGGDLIQFGVPKSEQLEIEYEKLFRKNLRLKASVHAQGEPGLTSFREATQQEVLHRVPDGLVGLLAQDDAEMAGGGGQDVRGV